MIGIIPAGDAVAAVGKAVKFIGRHGDEVATLVFRLVAKIDAVPNSAVRELLQAAGKRYDELKALGFSDDVLRRLMKGRGNVDNLVDAMGEARHVAGRPAGWLPTGRAGEELLEGWLGATTKSFDKQVYRSTEHLGIAKGRFFDVFVDRIAHESKVGYVSLSDAIRTQIRKDVSVDR